MKRIFFTAAGVMKNIRFVNIWDRIGYGFWHIAHI